MSEGTYDPKCAFCRIIRHEDSATILWQDREWVAFFPLEPATLGHTLIVPKDHIKNLWDVRSPLDATLMSAVIQIGNVIADVLKPDGMNLITSEGRTAEQTIFHLHLHLVPRWQTDGFGKIWPLDGKVDDAEVGVAAIKIRAALAQDPG